MPLEGPPPTLLPRIVFWDLTILFGGGGVGQGVKHYHSQGRLVLGGSLPDIIDNCSKRGVALLPAVPGGLVVGVAWWTFPQADPLLLTGRQVGGLTPLLFWLFF